MHMFGCVSNCGNQCWSSWINELLTRVIMISWALVFGVGYGFADDPTRDNAAPQAEPPRAATESLLPDVTKSFVSMPNFDTLRLAWAKTQFGKMTNDPLMAPFVKDLDRQIDERLAQTGSRLGLAWSDIRAVHGGEICIASLQPAGPKPKENYAMAVLVDVVGKDVAVDALLKKIDANMVARKAKKEERQIGGASARVYVLPKKRGARIQQKAIVLVHQNWLLAVDNDAIAEDIVARINGKPQTPSLASVPAFGQVMKKSAELSNGAPIHVRLFVEPFGLTVVSKAAQRAGRRSRTRRTNRAAALQNQGFSSIEGVGAQISFDSGGQDVLFHAFVYCPKENRVKAAKMLDFPNAGGQPFAWTPKDAAFMVTANWRLLKAFNSMEPLVNELMGDDVWDEIMEGIEKDKNGPQISLERDLIAHMKDRLTMFTDIKKPIGPESERFAIVVELKDVAAVRDAIKKAFKDDAYATPILYQGDTIWDIKDPNAKDRLFNNMSAVVHNGVLIIGSTVEYVKALMDRKPDNAFAKSVHYIAVENALKALGANGDAIRGYSDTQRATEANYEMLRANRLPESKSMLANFLNGLWPTGDEAVKREPKIDGKKLPPFGQVKQFFRPGGFYIHSTDSGWSIVGCLLP